MCRFGILLLFATAYAAGGENRTEVRLIEHLFDNYNVNALPRLPGKAVNLTFDVALRQLLDLDEKMQVIETSVWIRHYWHDPYLIWDPEEWGGLADLAISPDLIWRPDITLYNNAEKEFQGFDQFGRTKVNIYNDGSVTWLLPIILRSECKLEMEFFPFDSQVCPFVFGSWAFDGGVMDIHPKHPSGDLDSFSKSGEFTLSSFAANRVSTKYKCCPNPYVTITYNIHLHRRAKFYLFNLIIPGVLIALLSCFSFYLPPLSGERAGLIITNFLSLSVYVLLVSDSIPPSSETVPLLVKFYTIVVVEIGLALIANCIIIPLAARRVPVPSLVRKILLEPYTTCQALFRRKKDDVEMTKQNNQLSREMGFDNLGNPMIHTTTNGDHHNNSTAFTILNDRIASRVNKPDVNLLANDITDKEIDKSRSIRGLDLYEKKTLDYLRSISSYLRGKREDDRISADWEDVVKSIDKIFFVLFVFVILLSTALVSLEAPEIRM